MAVRPLLPQMEGRKSMRDDPNTDRSAPETLDYAGRKPRRKYITFTSHAIWLLLAPGIVVLLLSLLLSLLCAG